MEADEVELSLLDNMEEASSENAESVSGLSPAVVERCFRNLILQKEDDRLVVLHSQSRTIGATVLLLCLVAVANFPSSSTRAHLSLSSATTIQRPKCDLL
jgi:hypothetical protein